MDMAWRNIFTSGELEGPRVFACGNFLTTTGGHFLTSGHARECDDPYGFVNAVREQIKNCVDHIKLNLSGGVMGPFWDCHVRSFLLQEELAAVFALCRQRGYFALCRQRGYKVMALLPTNPATLPYGDSAATLPYADSAATLPYADSTATLPYADSAATLPYAGSAATLPYAGSAATLPYADSAATR